MVDESDLIKIEKVSDNLTSLLIAFEKIIENRTIKERFKSRAKNSFYQLLINLENEVNILKSNTLIIPQQLVELKIKINNLLRLADDMGIASSNEQLLNRIQENINFQHPDSTDSADL